MQFSTLTLSALLGVAAAQTKVHVVRVGSSSGSLTYSPNNVTAAVGDMVQFQFAAANHTVTQSTFDEPCQPIALNQPTTAGFFSGFMAVAKGATEVPTYTIQINSTTPIWVYCSQAQHCQKGMNLVINENLAANASRSLEAYTALAAKATANLPGTTVEGGASGTTSASGSSSSGSPASGGYGSTTSSAAGASTTGAATALTPSVAVGGMLAVFMALLM